MPRLSSACQRPCSRRALRSAWARSASGLLTLREIAVQFGVHTTTIKAWHQAGLLTSEKANVKNERLYQPPTPGDPRLVKQLGRPLSNREPIESTPGGAV
ncbi:MAG: MerR family transcriptional regulator [Thermoleophilia bacterium]|nr:MerR family transcriptional regulator [Thermoleophilia bacterium]